MNEDMDVEEFESTVLEAYSNIIDNFGSRYVFDGVLDFEEIAKDMIAFDTSLEKYDNIDDPELIRLIVDILDCSMDAMKLDDEE